jgi:hypothetical protein
MNPADEEAAKTEPTERPSAGAVARSHDNLEEQVHNLEEQLHDATLKDLQPTSHQSKPTADLHGSDDRLDEQVRVSVEALLHPSPPSIAAEEVDDLLLAISHHLDDETSERKKIYNRLLAIDSAMERRASRGFRYLVALCIGLAAILAWQSYGEAAKQIIAARAPELGWSPEAKQMIGGWVQQLGWTKPPVVESKAAPLTQTAPEMVAAKPATLALDPQQIQQIKTDVGAVREAVERQLAEMRKAVEQLAAGQELMVREVDRLQAANEEILAKIPTPPPKRPAPHAKPTPTAPSRSQAPTPPRPLPHP